MSYSPQSRSSQPRKGAASLPHCSLCPALPTAATEESRGPRRLFTLALPLMCSVLASQCFAMDDPP